MQNSETTSFFADDPTFMGPMAPFTGYWSDQQKVPIRLKESSSTLP